MLNKNFGSERKIQQNLNYFNVLKKRTQHVKQ